ncbi:MAG: hypothetical protein ABI395_11205 [Sphingobium sp.]
MIELKEKSSAIPLGRARPRHSVRAARSGIPIRRDPHARLIAQLLTLGGEAATVLEAQSRPWASATFVGAQHFVLVEFTESARDSPKAQAFADAFAEAEFAIPGHIVADATVDSRDTLWIEAGCVTRFRLVVLTIEEW